MAAADYRLMTEATGQRIAAALESLVNLGDPVTIAHGGTGASTAAAALSALGGVAVTDIVDDLTSTATNKPLSANMGRLLSNIGNVVYGTTTGSVSVPSGTVVVVGSITVSKGKWIIFGCCDWAPNGDGYRQIAFGSGVNPGRSMATTANGIENKELYQQVMSIFSTDTENVYTLNALQNSGSALNAYPFLVAVRIAN